MADPTKKARDADRDAAIEVVEAAYADGQITQADSELRVGRLLEARTLGDVETLVRDLQGAAPGGPEVSRLTSFAPQPPGAHPPPAGRGIPKVVWIIVAVFLGFAVVSVAVPLVLLSSVDSGESGSGGRVFESEKAAIPDLTTAAGLESFAAAVDEKTGSPVVFNATLYPTYAVVEVPVDGSGQRARGHYYDGGWQKWTGSGTAEETRLDLLELDGEAMERVVARVRRQVEDPTSSYLILNPTGREPGVCFSAYATNAVGETAYVNARCDGKVVFSYSG